jgi:soluble lytic murein transglycosylase-like protein
MILNLLILGTLLIPNENKYDELFQKYAGNIDWLLLKAQVKQESRFNPKAVSKAGAKGLAQFMPATWNEWGKGDVFNPEASISAQARYMAWLIKYYKGDINKALAGYNYGIGNVNKKLNIEPDFSKALLLMPKETQHYVKVINQYYNEYLAKQKKNPIHVD